MNVDEALALEIMAATAGYFGLPIAALVSGRRAGPRRIAMALCARRGLSPRIIGEAFDRDPARVAKDLAALSFDDIGVGFALAAIPVRIAGARLLAMLARRDKAFAALTANPCLPAHYAAPTRRR